MTDNWDRTTNLTNGTHNENMSKQTHNLNDSHEVKRGQRTRRGKFNVHDENVMLATRAVSYN